MRSLFHCFIHLPGRNTLAKSRAWWSHLFAMLLRTKNPFFFPSSAPKEDPIDLKLKLASFLKSSSLCRKFIAYSTSQPTYSIHPIPFISALCTMERWERWYKQKTYFNQCIGKKNSHKFPFRSHHPPRFTPLAPSTP